MSAVIHHETRHEHLALVFAERERLGLWRPSAFVFPRGKSASGQDPQGLGAKPANPARQGTAPLYSKDHPHA